ncbi:MAG: hypothetical protein K2X87_04125 [Gemmataceae bacterium]|nr:hypothetical protein [Gemmataceae bacterium]
MSVLRAYGERLLAQARAVRATFPNRAAMAALPVDPLPHDGGPLGKGLIHLRDELLLFQSGDGDLDVLDDEIACVGRMLGWEDPKDAGAASG